MHRIQTRNKISDIVFTQLKPDRFEIGDTLSDPHAILVRSADLNQDAFEASLLAVARAGAGYNNVPVDRLTQSGVVVFNTPGANANAVKELVITALLLSGRKILDGIAWSKTLQGQGDAVPALVEKGKGQFAGPELQGKTLGVMGLGAIGARVANTARCLGLRVQGFDPFLSVEGAWQLSSEVEHAEGQQGLLAQSDYLTLHLPLAQKTRGMVDAEFLAAMKPGATLLNFSRAELVDTDALKAALDSGQLAGYVTDFPQEALLGHEKILCIPHLGASTPESEENCAEMAAQQLKDYLLNGSIRNSVNLPACELGAITCPRLTLIHRNVSGMVGKIASVLAEQHLNIANMVNKSRGEVAYTAIDLDEAPDVKIVEALEGIENVIRVRLIG